MRFVVKERLGWGEGDMEDLKPRGMPFEFDGRMDGLLHVTTILTLHRGYQNSIQ